MPLDVLLIKLNELSANLQRKNYLLLMYLGVFRYVPLDVLLIKLNELSANLQRKNYLLLMYLDSICAHKFRMWPNNRLASILVLEIPPPRPTLQPVWEFLHLPPSAAVKWNTSREHDRT